MITVMIEIQAEINDEYQKNGYCTARNKNKVKNIQWRMWLENALTVRSWLSYLGQVVID